MDIRSELSFSQVREDSETDLRVVEQLATTLDRPLRVLLVASGGCTALSLLSHSSIQRVDAIDVNPAQLHLVELRRSAITKLSIVEQLEFIGATPATAMERLEYYRIVRSVLPSDSQIFWDERSEQIAFGVNRVGKFEALFRRLVEQSTALGLDPLHQPKTAIQHSQWKALFESVFERSQLIEAFGEAAVNYSMDRSFGEHFADVFAQALTRFSPLENYFLTQVWDDRYAIGEAGLPCYLQLDRQLQILKLGLDRLHLHLGSFPELMVTLGTTQPYDLIQCSNISDWMPIPELKTLLTNAFQCLTPGGALIGRRLNGDHHLGDLMDTVLKVDRSFSADLKRFDRSFFYSEIVVGYRR
jgi:S-adenosylmethionine-diacylglycerol 3-amino-3-carboxypropyl transferase